MCLHHTDVGRFETEEAWGRAAALEELELAQVEFELQEPPAEEDALEGRTEEDLVAKKLLAAAKALKSWLNYPLVKLALKYSVMAMKLGTAATEKMAAKNALQIVETVKENPLVVTEASSTVEREKLELEEVVVMKLDEVGDVEA